MKATIVLAGLPKSARDAAARRLHGLGACVLSADDAPGACRHVRGGVVDAVVLDAALERSQQESLAELLQEARSRGVLVLGVGEWSAHGHRLAARLDAPLDAGELSRALSGFLG